MEHYAPRNDYGDTALSAAAEGGDREVVDEIKQNVERVDAAALCMACQRGDVAIVRLLAESNIVNEARAPDGVTPLYLASTFGHGDVAGVLLERGADPGQLVDFRGGPGAVSPLLAACEEGHLEAVRLLVESGADVDKAKNDGTTPLYIACQCGHLDVAQLLVEKGADMDKARDDGETPLFIARQWGHTEIAAFLEQAGATE